MPPIGKGRISTVMNTPEPTPSSPDWSDAVFKASVEIEDLYNNRKENCKSLTGLPALDLNLCGLREEGLLVMKGLPGTGMSSLARNIVLNNVLGLQHVTQKPVVVFDSRLSEKDFAFRLMCIHEKLNAQRLMHGQISRKHYERLLGVSNKLKETSLHFRSLREFTIDQLVDEVRMLKDTQQIELLVIDKLDLFFSAPPKEVEVAGVITKLKALSKELHLPIITFCYLDRGSEISENFFMPSPEDLNPWHTALREADVIGLMYRPSLFPEHWLSDDGSLVIVELVRNNLGFSGTLNLNYSRETQLFQERSDAVSRDDAGFDNDLPF